MSKIDNLKIQKSQVENKIETLQVQLEFLTKLIVQKEKQQELQVSLLKTT